MRISVYGGADARHLDQVVDRTARAAADGFDAIWFPQTAGLDALTALAVAARAVPGIDVGTAVVPIQGRHPIPLAQQALTVAEAAGPGRFTLGVGVTHAPVSEGWYGIPYAGVVDRCAEELEALDGLLGQGHRAHVEGEHLTARVALDAEVARPGLVLAALGPRMLGLAGRWCDGTVTWMTGRAALAGHVVPRLREAAATAGRPAPRVVAGLPVCVTDDEADGRARAARAMSRSAQLDSYRRMLAAEGAPDAGAIALVGDEAAVAAQVAALAQAGATELLAYLIGTPEEQVRARALLPTLRAP